MAARRFFETGELRLAILSLLGEGPKHGYQLMKEMQERSGGAYRASAGSVYPTLQQLEDEGLVGPSMQSGRRVYQLTRGRPERAGTRSRNGVRRIWERAERCEDWGQFMGPETFSTVRCRSPFWLRASMRAAGRAGTERVREILDRAAASWKRCSELGASVYQEGRRMGIGIRIEELRKVYDTPPPSAARGGGFSFTPMRTGSKEKKEKKKFEVVALDDISLEIRAGRGLRPARARTAPANPPPSAS